MQVGRNRQVRLQRAMFEARCHDLRPSFGQHDHGHQALAGAPRHTREIAQAGPGIDQQRIDACAAISARALARRAAYSSAAIGAAQSVHGCNCASSAAAVEPPTPRVVILGILCFACLRQGLVRAGSTAGASR
jgi:hypothetical protein